MIKQSITPNFWFDKEAKEAAEFYVSVFANRPGATGKSEITKISYYGKEGFDIHKMPEGTVMTVDFILDNQEFLALNGGPIFKFNESVSFIINCENQKEVDYFWDRLTAEGLPQPCGWLKDKFGLSWQVVPVILNELMTDPDREKAGRAMNAMLQMKKIEIDKLLEA